ncbi:MAG: hypothetical protein AAGB16_00935 [Pseudomonadota bacterium]
MTKAGEIKTNIWNLACLWVSVVLFLLGAAIHAFDIAVGGWLPYTYVPDWINAYWTALLPLDLAAAIMMWRRMKLGIILALLIMISDVWINTLAHAILGGGSIFWGYIIQVMFLGFLLAFVGPYWAMTQKDRKNADRPNP